MPTFWKLHKYCYFTPNNNNYPFSKKNSIKAFVIAHAVKTSIHPECVAAYYYSSAISVYAVYANFKLIGPGRHHRPGAAQDDEKTADVPGQLITVTSDGRFSHADMETPHPHRVIDICICASKIKGIDGILISREWRKTRPQSRVNDDAKIFSPVMHDAPTYTKSISENCNKNKMMFEWRTFFGENDDTLRKAIFTRGSILGSILNLSNQYTYNHKSVANSLVQKAASS